LQLTLLAPSTIEVILAGQEPEGGLNELLSEIGSNWQELVCRLR
jgi:hypothetical protein